MEYYLAKGLLIIEQNSKKLSIIPNKAKQITHLINIHDSEFVMACYKKIPSMANTVNK